MFIWYYHPHSPKHEILTTPPNVHSATPPPAEDTPGEKEEVAHKAKAGAGSIEAPAHLLQVSPSATTGPSTAREARR